MSDGKYSGDILKVLIKFVGALIKMSAYPSVFLVFVLLCLILIAVIKLSVVF